MKAFLAKIEAIWMAVTFAEAGEWDTAKEFLKPFEKRIERESSKSKRPYLRA